MEIDHDRISFTYWLKWKCGTQYYGVRHAKGCHYSDLGTKYKSSSKHVKAFIKEHGEPEYVVDRIFLNSKAALAHEHSVLKAHDAANNPEFLNRSNGAEKFVNKGGYYHTDKAKRKISEAQKGKKLSEDHKRKISLVLTGKPLSEEHKQKMSMSRKGKPLSEKHKLNMRKPLSEEHKQNMRKPKSVVECPHCGKAGGSNVMKRWHFENCKQRK